MFSHWELPKQVELDGIILHLNTDYRDIQDIIKIYSRTDISNPIKATACLQIFIDNYEKIRDAQNALNMMMLFINLGQEEKQDDKQLPKEIDWEQDYLSIVSDMNKTAGFDIRTVPYMHWWTFMSIFNGIGEGNTSYVVSLRRKLRRGEKLSKDEKEYYLHNRDRIDLKQNCVSEEEKKRLKARFG